MPNLDGIIWQNPTVMESIAPIISDVTKRMEDTIKDKAKQDLALQAKNQELEYRKKIAEQKLKTENAKKAATLPTGVPRTMLPYESSVLQKAQEDFYRRLGAANLKIDDPAAVEFANEWNQIQQLRLEAEQRNKDYLQAYEKSQLLDPNDYDVVPDDYVVQQMDADETYFQEQLAQNKTWQEIYAGYKRRGYELPKKKAPVLQLDATDLPDLVIDVRTERKGDKTGDRSSVTTSNPRVGQFEKELQTMYESNAKPKLRQIIDNQYTEEVEEIDFKGAARKLINNAREENVANIKKAYEESGDNFEYAEIIKKHSKDGVVDYDKAFDEILEKIIDSDAKQIEKEYRESGKYKEAITEFTKKTKKPNFKKAAEGLRPIAQTRNETSGESDIEAKERFVVNVNNPTPRGYSSGKTAKKKRAEGVSYEPQSLNSSEDGTTFPVWYQAEGETLPEKITKVAVMADKNNRKIHVLDETGAPVGKYPELDKVSNVVYWMPITDKGYLRRSKEKDRGIAPHQVEGFSVVPYAQYVGEDGKTYYVPATAIDSDYEIIEEGDAKADQKKYEQGLVKKKTKEDKEQKTTIIPKDKKPKETMD